MKIGIITIHKSPNYGGSLQAFALYHYLINKGMNCELVDLYRPSIKGYVKSEKYKRLVKDKELNHSFFSLLKHWLIQKVDKWYIKSHKQQLERKSKRFQSFFDEIAYSKPYVSIDRLYEDSLDYDILITGSDQVWNPTMRYNIEPFFLTFAPSVSKKISYASSIGLNTIPRELQDQYRKWLNDYTAIGVREEQAKMIIHELLPSKEIEVVCDPTLLLSSDYWIERADLPEEKGYLLCFTLSYNKALYDYATKIAKEKGLQMIVFSHGAKEESYPNVKLVYDAGPLQWIGWINNSHTVITDSFHATIFSMHCRKPFQTYISASSKRGSRIEELLNRVGLEKHLIRDLKKLQTPPEPNYTLVWNALDSYIGTSKKFLDKSLSNEQNRIYNNTTS